MFLLSDFIMWSTRSKQISMSHSLICHWNNITYIPRHFRFGGRGSGWRGRGGGYVSGLRGRGGRGGCPHNYHFHFILHISHTSVMFDPHIEQICFYGTYSNSPFNYYFRSNRHFARALKNSFMHVHNVFVQYSWFIIF